MNNYRQVKWRFFLIWKFVPVGKMIKAYTIYSLFPNYFSPGTAVQMLKHLKKLGLGKGVVKDGKYYFQKLK